MLEMVGSAVGSGRGESEGRAVANDARVCGAMSMIVLLWRRTGKVRKLHVARAVACGEDAPLDATNA